MKRLKILLQSNLFYIFLGLFLIIYILFRTQFITYKSKFPDDIKNINAILIAYKIDGDKLSMQLKEREKFVATYYFANEQEKNYYVKNLYVGLHLKLNGEKQELSNNTVPNTFNYKKYLYQRKIYFSFSVKKITIMANSLTLTNKIKNVINKRIQKLGGSPYLQAFILGDKSFMQYDMQEKIQENGISHLFALSGMHLAFFVMFLNKCLEKMKYKKVFIYTFLIFYLTLASFPVSFIRAILLMLCLDISKAANFSLSSIKSLMLIAAILLIFNPFYIYDLGFLYSFIVTFSLLYSKNLLQGKNKIGELFLMSVITFLFSAPITIYSNFEINLTSILNNMIFVPLVSSLIFPLAILTFCFSFLAPIFNLAITILESLNAFFNNFSCFLIFGKISIFEVLIYYFFLMAMIKLANPKIIGLFFLFVLFLYNKDFFNFYYSIYYIDVGQGDSILLVSPQNKEVFLIDTGGKITFPKDKWQQRENEFTLSKNTIILLKSLRIKKIDYLILTHGDYDHMGESSNLIQNFKVKNVIFNCGKFNDLEQDLIKKLNKKEIAYHNCIKELNIDNTSKLLFLNNNEYDNENDNSNVIYTEIYNYKFLFMGDASVKVENDLLTKYNLSNIDVLKVGHHGSKTSSDCNFITKINPKYSIISVGKNNRYGHPNKEVLENLSNSQIYRTDEDGSISFFIKKKKLKIATSKY